MMRTKVAAKVNNKDSIKWRSHEPSRIETFSDAAFAFALTLIIVSIEIPKTFDDLMGTMHGAVSFALCFAVLFNIWNSQNIFFRRYGVNDNTIVTLNAILLFVVLMYAYPLRFLFDLVTSSEAKQHLMIRQDQVQSLMLIYGAGFVAIYLLFYLMHRHVIKMADQLELSASELYATRTNTAINLICVCICLVAIAAALILPGPAGSSGFVYFLFPVAYFVWFSYRGKKRRELFPEA